MSTISSRSSWMALALALAFLAGSLAPVSAGPGKGDPRVYRTRVYRLKNFSAEKAKDLLEELLTEPLDVLGPAKPGGGNPFDGPGANPSGLGGGLGTLGGGGTRGQGLTVPTPPGGFGGAQAPGGLVPGGPMGIGGIGPGNASRGPGPKGVGGKRFPGDGIGQGDTGSSDRFRLMLDDKTGSILMRGPEPDVFVADELMKILELPADRPLPANLVAMRAFRVGESDPTKLAEKLQGLGYKAKIVAVPDLKLVLAAGPDEDLKEITDAIKALDGSGEKAATDEKSEKPKEARPPTEEDEDGQRKKIK